MKIITSLSLIFFCSNLFADCYSIFGRADSKHFQMNVSSVVASDSLKTMASYAITRVFAQNKCIDYQVTNLECSKVIKKLAETEVCYAKTEYGYFLVSKDMMDNVNIIFNRWD